MNDSKNTIHKAFLDNIQYLEDEATADIAFIANGNTISSAFANAALAVTHLIVDIDSIEPNQNKHDTWQAEDLKGLLYDFIDRIIYQFDTEHWLYSIIEANIIQITSSIYQLEISGNGEYYDEKKHIAKRHIKAVTFFGMEIHNNSVKVTLDI